MRSRTPCRSQTPGRASVLPATTPVCTPRCPGRLQKESCPSCSHRAGRRSWGTCPAERPSARLDTLSRTTQSFSPPSSNTSRLVSRFQPKPVCTSHPRRVARVHRWILVTLEVEVVSTVDSDYSAEVSTERCAPESVRVSVTVEHEIVVNVVGHSHLRPCSVRLAIHLVVGRIGISRQVHWPRLVPRRRPDEIRSEPVVEFPHVRATSRIRSVPVLLIVTVHGRTATWQGVRAICGNRGRCGISLGVGCNDRERVRASGEVVRVESV